MDLIESKINLDNSSKRHPWELARIRVFEDLIKPFLNLNKPISILDLGCGDVFFIGSITSKYPNVKGFGVDINFTDTQIEDFKKLYPNVSLYKTLKELYSEVDKLDIVLLMDVIEHIDNDYLFIKNELTTTIQNYNPLVFITVPAFQSLYSNHDVLLQHYRRYNHNSLSKLLNQNNIRIIKNGYFFFSLIILRIVEKIKELTLSKKQEGVANWSGNAFLTKLIVNILFWDYKLTSFISFVKIPGLTTYALCSKYV